MALDAVRGHVESLGWARWQLPDRVEVIDRSVGKFDNQALRASLANLDGAGKSGSKEG